MASLISFLSTSEKRELMDDLNYLNLEEIRRVLKVLGRIGVKKGNNDG